MEVAVRVLNLLLILVFVFQGLCAVPEIGKRQWFLWEIIPDIAPDIIPDIPKDPIPDIPGDPVPDIPGGPVLPGDGGPVITPTLGEYLDKNNQAPFSGTVLCIARRINGADRGVDLTGRVGSILLQSRRYPRSRRNRRRRQ